MENQQLDNDTRGWVMSAVSGVGELLPTSYLLVLLLTRERSMHSWSKYNMRRPLNTIYTEQTAFQDTG